VTDISRGLNTGIQVKLHSLANLDGAFNWIKDEIKDETYAGLISWREGDEGEFDVRDLICVMEALNAIDFPNDKPVHPIQAYEKWSAPVARFAKDFQSHEKKLDQSTYFRLRPLLRGGLRLFDRIRHDFRTVHNENGGSAGKLKIIEEAGKDRQYSFPFAGLDPQRYRLTKGALYPILAAFRNCVSVPSGKNARWIDSFDSVLELWKESASELVAETFNATKDIGNLPDQIGKSRGHWANIHKTLKLRMLERRMAKTSR
jgi:hypothetical protein